MNLRLLKLGLALIMILGSVFVYIPSAEAGVAIQQGFTSVQLSCPDTVNYAGQWNSGDGEVAYVRIYESGNTSSVIDEAFYQPSDLGLNSFSGSFTLPTPLPSNVTIEVWEAFQGQVTKTFGLAKLMPPQAFETVSGTPNNGPPLPSGYFGWNLLDSQSLSPNCETVVGCTLQFPIYGTALVTNQQVGYASPNGEIARDQDNRVILLLHDLDNDGADTYLIVDIQEGAEGETWLGLFIGSCDPVYVQLQDVQPLNAIPLP